MDVLRRILLSLEDTPAGKGKRFVYDKRLSDIDAAVLKEHIHLVVEEQLAEIRLLEALGCEWGVSHARLLSRGHDFVDAVRTPNRLRQAIDWITGTGRAVTVQLIIEWAKRVVSSE